MWVALIEMTRQFVTRCSVTEISSAHIFCWVEGKEAWNLRISEAVQKRCWKQKGSASALKHLCGPKQASSGRGVVSKMLLQENTTASGDGRKIENKNQNKCTNTLSSLALNYLETLDRSTQLLSLPSHETPNSNLLCYRGCVLLIDECSVPIKR